MCTSAPMPDTEALNTDVLNNDVLINDIMNNDINLLIKVVRYVGVYACVDELMYMYQYQIPCYHVKYYSACTCW